VKLGRFGAVDEHCELVWLPFDAERVLIDVEDELEAPCLLLRQRRRRRRRAEG
jgi:hypothetical protein